MKSARNLPVRGTLANLGEERLIQSIRDWLGAASPPPPRGMGDDCAVWTADRSPRKGKRAGSRSCSLLLKVDPVVRGRHFDDKTPARAVAAKLLKRNLSDVAAMGGIPRAALLAVAAPPNLPIAWLREFYRALGGIARQYRVQIVGGDCTATPGFLGLFLTLVGESPARPLTRRGARAGDRLFVTGTLGGSLLGRHLRFTPRLEEGAWLAQQPFVHAAIDVSDGLGKDLAPLVPRGCAAVIDSTLLPASRAAVQSARRSRRPLLDAILNDGEDHELLFAAAAGASADLVRRWRQRFTTRLTCIGRIETVRRGEPLVRFEPPLPAGIELRGYEHFR